MLEVYGIVSAREFMVGRDAHGTTGGQEVFVRDLPWIGTPPDESAYISRGERIRRYVEWY